MGGTRCRLQEEASVSQALCEKGQIPGKKPWLCTHSSIWGSTSLSSSKYPGQGMTKLGNWGGLLEIRSMEYDFLIQGGTEEMGRFAIEGSYGSNLAFLTWAL